MAKQNVGCACTVPRQWVSAVRSDNDIGDAVIIEIPRLSQTESELIRSRGTEDAKPLRTGDAAKIKIRKGRLVGVTKDDVHGAGCGSVRCRAIVADRAHQDIVEPIVIEVAGA
jgi:hypothetical protein